MNTNKLQQESVENLATLSDEDRAYAAKFLATTSDNKSPEAYARFMDSTGVPVGIDTWASMASLGRLISKMEESNSLP